MIRNPKLSELPEVDEELTRRRMETIAAINLQADKVQELLRASFDETTKKLELQGRETLLRVRQLGEEIARGHETQLRSRFESYAYSKSFQHRPSSSFVQLAARRGKLMVLSGILGALLFPVVVVLVSLIGSLGGSHVALVIGAVIGLAVGMVAVLGSPRRRESGAHSYFSYPPTFRRNA